MFNKNKFKARIVEAGFNMEYVAKSIGVNAATLYRKMNGTSDFTRTEIQKLQKVLSLDVEKVVEIFFA